MNREAPSFETGKSGPKKYGLIITPGIQFDANDDDRSCLYKKVVLLEGVGSSNSTKTFQFVPSKFKDPNGRGGRGRVILFPNRLLAAKFAKNQLLPLVEYRNSML